MGRELASPRDQPLPSCGSRMSRGQGGQLSVRSRLGNTNYHCYRNSLICYTLTPCGSGFHRYQSRRGRERADNPPRAPSSWRPSQESGLGLSTLPARVESAALPPATRSLSPRHTHVPRPQRCHPCTGTRAPASRGDVGALERHPSGPAHSELAANVGSSSLPAPGRHGRTPLTLHPGQARLRVVSGQRNEL